MCLEGTDRKLCGTVCSENLRLQNGTWRHHQHCFIRQVSSVKTTSEETLQKYASHTAHIFTCRGTWPSHSSPQACQSVSKMLCRAAAGVDAHVTRDVSHSIPTAGTGDYPRGQKWAKDRNSTPFQISCVTASTASVIHSSCDTAAMCRGGFLRNGTVELESLKILLESALTYTLRPTWIDLKIMQA